MDKNKYDAVIVFPFGGDATSGTNTALLSRAVEEATNHNALLIVHESLRKLYKKKDTRIVMFEGATICQRAQKAKERMVRETGKNVLVIAATPIMDRCIRDLKKLHPKGMTFRECEEIRRDTPYSLWFWEKGKKFEKLRAVACFIKEKLLRCVPWAIYKFFALWVC